MSEDIRHPGTSDLNCETLFIASTSISQKKKILKES